MLADIVPFAARAQGIAHQADGPASPWLAPWTRAASVALHPPSGVPTAAPWRDLFGLEGFPKTLAVAGRATPTQHLKEMQAFVAQSLVELDRAHAQLLVRLDPQRHPERTADVEALRAAYDQGGRELGMLARHLAQLAARRRQRVRAGDGCRPLACG